MLMNNYEENLKEFLHENKVKGELLFFEKSVHTVEDACREVNRLTPCCMTPLASADLASNECAQPDDFVKTICMIADDGKVIGAIVLGSCRASTERVAKALNIERPQVATPEQATEKTGYLVGGTPPFGYEATFLIDPKVMKKEIVYAGGGTPNALLKIGPKEIQRINHAVIARIRK